MSTVKRVYKPGIGTFPGNIFRTIKVGLEEEGGGMLCEYCIELARDLLCLQMLAFQHSTPKSFIPLGVYAAGRVAWKNPLESRMKS